MPCMCHWLPFSFGAAVERAVLLGKTSDLGVRCEAASGLDTVWIAAGEWTG
jgi:hypothetical protein